MYLQIFEKIKTRNDVQILLEEIQTLKESLYQEDLAESLESKVRFWVYDAIKDDFTAQKDKEKFLTDLAEELSKLEKLTVTLAYEPSKREVDKIYAKFQEALKSKFILDIKINPNLVAGAIFEYKGMYGDYSLGKKVANIMHQEVKNDTDVKNKQ